LTRIARNISSAIKRIIAIVANSMNFEKMICKDTIVTCMKIKMRCFFFSSINYIIWVIWNMYHTILKNVFVLRDHDIRRILIDRMNKIWKRQWNIANVKRRHFNWLNWNYAHRIWVIVFLFVTMFDFCWSYLIALSDCFD
jgi:hypothetical protein